MALLKVPFYEFITKPVFLDLLKERLIAIKIWQEEKVINMENRTGYGFFFYTPLFFMLSFTGWLWEALIYFIQEGQFINRGVLFGPWLPVYGCGGIALTMLLRGWGQKPVRVFFLSMLICSVLEYLVSWCLERVWGIRWWDYSNDFLNISGRICLWGSLMFGLGGWLLVCYIVPYLRFIYRKLWKIDKARTILELVCLGLILVFVADAAWAADFPNMGKGISTEISTEIYQNACIHL